jgi:hypothetical protein
MTFHKVSTSTMACSTYGCVGMKLCTELKSAFRKVYKPFNLSLPILTVIHFQTVVSGAYHACT